MSTDRESLKEALSSVDFPADKETLVSHAQTRSGDDSVAQALRAMPPAEYANLGEVIQIEQNDDQSTQDVENRHEGNQVVGDPAD